MIQLKEKEYKEVSDKDLCTYSGLASTSSYIEDETNRKTKKNKQGAKRD